MEANKCECNDLNLMWNALIDYFGVSEETLKVTTMIDGYNAQTLHDVLYAVAGERLFDFEDPDVLVPREI